MHFAKMNKDLQLIQLLKRNARASVSDLARRLGVSRTTIAHRIEKLEKQGIIQGYTLKLGDNAEQIQIQAHTNLVVEPSENANIVKQLNKISVIETLYAVSGKIDFIAIIHTSSTAELDKYLDQISKISGIKSTETAIVLATKFDRS